MVVFLFYNVLCENGADNPGWLTDHLVELIKNPKVANPGSNLHTFF